MRMNDLVQQTPSVTSQGTAGRTSVVNFGIRGQRSTDVLPTVDPSVIVYIADVPQMRGYGLGALGALDIQTVEVLKGPQGTLFGRSTTGGAIVITPNAPTEERSASLSLGLGDYNRTMARFIGNLPITDSIAARVAVQKERQDGFLENKGPIGHDDYADRDELSWRASLQFAPTDALTSTFYTDGFETDESGPMADARYVRPGSPAFNLGLRTDGDPYSGRTNVRDGHSRITVYGVSNTTSYELSDALTIKNILGYRKIDVDDRWDLDGSQLPVLDVRNLATTHQYSEELQFSGAVGDTLDWIAGVFWFKEYSPDNSYTYTFGNPLNSITGTYGRNISQSIFGQGTWHITDDLNLTIGARYNDDQREIESSSFTATGLCTIEIAPNVRAPNNNCKRRESESFNEPTYNITLDYHIAPDMMTYIAHRHGYRSGGFNGRAAQDVTFTPFQPEIVDDLEVGFKSDLELMGSPLRFNTAIFYSDYQDIQRLTSTVNASGQLATNVLNAATATLYGGEIDATWLPTDSIQIDVFYAYLHARYDEWLDPLAANPAARDKSDYKFASPAHSGGVTVKYTLPTPAEIGIVSIQGNVYAQSDTQLADENGIGNTQSGYSLVGARLDWQEVMGSQLKLSLWGRNLNNTEYYSGGVNTVGNIGYYMGYPGVPRTWGIDATYEF
jgi:iron complex outermembrane receptor protein